MLADLLPPEPDELQVEVTGACNLRCRMCLVRYREPLDRTSASMGLDELRALLDQLPGLWRLTLQGLGEPLLAPDLLDMVDLACARGIEVGFNTNATALTRAKCERIVAAGVHWVHVSIDGATRETFEHIRDGASFDRVVRNLETLLDVKRAHGSERPFVQLNTVVMRRNLDELLDLVELAARLGVARHWVQALSHDFSDTDPAGDYVEIRRFAHGESLDPDAPNGRVLEVFAAARQRADALGVELRLPGVGHAPDERDDSGRPCDWPWRSAYVKHDGRVQPCCMVMGADRAVLGSLAEQSFAEIWHGEPARDFRRALLSDDPPAVCRGCSVYRRRF